MACTGGDVSDVAAHPERQRLRLLFWRFEAARRLIDDFTDLFCAFPAVLAKPSLPLADRFRGFVRRADKLQARFLAGRPVLVARRTGKVAGRPVIKPLA